MVRRRMISEDDMRQRLRVNVRSLRNAAGLTAKAASAKGKMSLRHWQKVEAGEANVTLNTLAKLCTALEVDAAELLSEPPRGGRGAG